MLFGKIDDIFAGSLSLDQKMGLISHTLATQVAARFTQPPLDLGDLLSGCAFFAEKGGEDEHFGVIGSSPMQRLVQEPVFPLAVLVSDQNPHLEDLLRRLF